MVPYFERGFECGIFAVTVCLHLSEQKSVDRSSFSQGNAKGARTLLSSCLCDKLLSTLGLHVTDKEEMDTSKRYFRGCFPQLSGDCITFDGLDILSAEYPPIPTRRITTPSTVTMSRTREAKSKRAIKKNEIASESCPFPAGLPSSVVSSVLRVGSRQLSPVRSRSTI
jgi:hypothetical protein